LVSAASAYDASQIILSWPTNARGGERARQWSGCRKRGTLITEEVTSEKEKKKKVFTGITSPLSLQFFHDRSALLLPSPRNRNISSASSTARIEFWPSTRGRARNNTISSHALYRMGENSRDTLSSPRVATTMPSLARGDAHTHFTQCQIVWQINRTKTPVPQATRNHSPHPIMDRQPQRPSYATTFLHSDARNGGSERTR